MIKRFKKYLPEFVYGGVDGSVTTFAVVSGAVGANLETRIILILGFANLLADGFSMSIGAYLSSKAELQQKGKTKKHSKTPFNIGLATFISFLFIGIIPLSIYVINIFTENITHLFFWASILTFIGFAFIGLLKSLITQKSKLISIGETLILGALAAAVAYYVGDFLEKIV